MNILNISGKLYILNCKVIFSKETFWLISPLFWIDNSLIDFFSSFLLFSVPLFSFKSFSNSSSSRDISLNNCLIYGFLWQFNSKLGANNLKVFIWLNWKLIIISKFMINFIIKIL